MAVVELALASGLVLLPVEELEPLTANSFGTGELVAAALDQGCTQIILGVGGSASTDGGAGLLQALGARFLDHEGEELPLGGGSLVRLYEVDLSELDWRLDGVEFILASDVDNPLLGPRGAAHVYGPQKGATPDDVELLDVGLGRLADAIDPGAADIPGAGAAGGVGFAALSVLRATPQPGHRGRARPDRLREPARRRAAGHHRRRAAGRADPARQGARRRGGRGRRGRRPGRRRLRGP